MATYSSAPTESIIRYYFKKSNNDGGTGGSGPFIEDLGITVGANEEYQVLNAFWVGHSANISFRINGFIDTYLGATGSTEQNKTETWIQSVGTYSDGTNYPLMEAFSTLSEGSLQTSMIPSAFQTSDSDDYGGVKIGYTRYAIAGSSTNSSTTNPNGAAYWDEHATFRQGYKLYAWIDVDYGTPSTKEFAELYFYIKKTVYNG